MAGKDTPRKVVKRLLSPAKHKFCVVCAKDIAIAFGAYQDFKRKLWTDANTLNQLGVQVESYLNAKLCLHSDSRVICRNCQRKIKTCEDSRNKAKETFAKGRETLSKDFSVPVTQKRGVPSDVADPEKLPKSRARLSWSPKKEKPIPPDGSVEVRV